MGRTYVFDCVKCGYQAKVAGGLAEGLEFTVQTIVCHECRELTDAVISAKVAAVPSANELKPESEAGSSPPSFADIINRLPLMMRIPTRQENFAPVCLPFPSHEIRPWNQPDKCPRCGAFMECSAIPFRQWD
jgi:hypothetical protein